MKLKDGQSNEVAIKKEAGALASINIEQFADTGFDNVDSKSLAYPMSIKYKQLENPPRKRNRDRWLVEICHTEYTVDEIAEGLWLTRLKNGLE